MFENYLRSHVYINTDRALGILHSRLAHNAKHGKPDCAEDVAAWRLFSDFDMIIFKNSYCDGIFSSATEIEDVTESMKAVIAHVTSMQFMRMQYLTSDHIVNILSIVKIRPAARLSTMNFLRTYQVILVVKYNV